MEQHWLLPILVICFLLSLLGFIQSKVVKHIAVILLGLGVGLGWNLVFDQVYLSQLQSMDGENLEVEIQASDYSEMSNYGISGDGIISVNGKEYQVRYYLDEITDISPGDVLRGTFQLQVTVDSEDVPFDYHSSKGVFLLAYAQETPVVERASVFPLRFGGAWLARQITQIMNSVFPEDVLGFVRALLLGDCSLLTYEQDTDLKISGIRHIVAVSGLHVSILFSLVYFITGKRKLLTALLGIPVLILFAAMAGFTPSIVRACVMQILMLLAILWDREYDPATALSFAVLIMLAWNPLTITSVSFQLSVGCIIGILMFQQRISQYLHDERRFGAAKGRSIKARLIRFFISSISVSLSAMVFTVPLCAWYFGTVSLISVVTNLLTLWMISFIFYGIMIACAAGAVFLQLGELIAWLVAWPIRWVFAIAKFCASLPFAAVYTESEYIVLWLVSSYLLFFIFLCIRKKHVLQLIVSIAVTLAISVTASVLTPRLDPYRITFLDVGQGQCTLIQNEGSVYIVDCGGSNGGDVSDLVAQTLLSQGVDRIDGMILTHYDADHAGGVAPLATRIDIGAVYGPDVADENGVPEQLEALFGEKFVRVSLRQTLNCENVTFQLYPAEGEFSDNENSMCILCQVENCDILFTGDRSSTGERTLIRDVALPCVDILVAGHHGAKDATSLWLLRACKPQYAVISVGDDNPYGHPSQEVLDRLALYECCVLRTDTDGTICFKGSNYG